MKKKLMCGILAASMLTVLGAGADAETGRWDCTSVRDADNNITVAFPDFTLTLPSDWAGQCQIIVSDESAEFCQTASRKLYSDELGYPNGGWLFSIAFSDDTSFSQLPSYETLMQVSDGYYYAIFPTDVQGYPEDPYAMEQYTDMYWDVEQIIDSIHFTRADAVPVIYEHEFILPQSSDEFITEADLYGMTADEVQMAINEIYARHNRKFVKQDVQDYFNSRIWYTGIIEPSDFDSSMLSSLEWANIDLMLKYMKTAPASSDEITIVLSDANS